MKNILAALLIISSVGIFYFIISPAYADIGSLRATKNKYDEALNHSQEAKGLRDALETKYNNISSSNLKRLDSFLPDSIDNIRLIIEIDKIAGRYNMTLSDAQVVLASLVENQNIEDAVVLESTPNGTGKLNFSVTGTYEAYISFIKDLEKSLRLINITSISLSKVSDSDKDKEKSSSELYQYKTSLDTYWLK